MAARRFSAEPSVGTVMPEPEVEIPMRNGRPYDPAWDAWRPPRRWPGIIMSALAMAVFIGAVAYHYSSHGHAKAPSFRPPAVDRVQPAYALPVSGSATQSYSGRSNRSNLSFTATGNFMVWDLRCAKCVENFGVIVHNANNLTVDIPVNTLGPSQASYPATYPKGTYYVTVIADAPWTISLVDPTSLATIATPFNYFSSGSSVVGPFSGQATSVVMGYVAAQGTIATVRLYDASLKTQPQLLISSAENFFKSLTLTPPDKYYLVINTIGLWDLKVGG